jgi:hypothetical protein
MKEWISNWGIPENIRSDGGPQFRTEFNDFCNENAINHETTSPYHPQANGHAEAAVKSMKLLLQKFKTNWEDFQSSLLEWRNTPKNDGFSPAQWIFGRRQRTKIPGIPHLYHRIETERIREHEEKRNINKEKEKSRFDQKAKELPKLTTGDKVLIQDPKSRKWDEEGLVIARENERSYLVQRSNGTKFLRNRKMLKSYD